MTSYNTLFTKRKIKFTVKLDTADNINLFGRWLSQTQSLRRRIFVNFFCLVGNFNCAKNTFICEMILPVLKYQLPYRLAAAVLRRPSRGGRCLAAAVSQRRPSRGGDGLTELTVEIHSTTH